MADIFISYSQKDRRRVEPLVDALKAEGYIENAPSQVDWAKPPGMAAAAVDYMDQVDHVD